MSFCPDDKFLQVMAHLYRGEMNRMTIYRQRLDMISTWSMTLLATLSVIYINTGLPIDMILLFIVPIVFFSCMEARRYRYFVISRHRVRLIEQGFFVGDLLEDPVEDIIDLRHRLIASLRLPNHIISFFRAWSIRFYRNYIWFLYFIGVSMWFHPFHPMYISILYDAVVIILHIFLYTFGREIEIDL
jgi:uncharacterized membrane protein